VPIASELILSANKHFKKATTGRHHRYSNSLRVEIKNRVEKYLTLQGMPQAEIEILFERGITKLLKKHYPKCPDAKPFATESDQYKKWYWSYRVRNAMTHSGSNVPEEDAWQAFGWYHATFRYLFGKTLGFNSRNYLSTFSAVVSPKVLPRHPTSAVETPISPDGSTAPPYIRTRLPDFPFGNATERRLCLQS